MMLESERFDAKFTIPQLVQCHEMLFNVMYTGSCLMHAFNVKPFFAVITSFSPLLHCTM